MLKEYLTMELEKIQSRKDGYLQECRKLEAVLKEADTLPMEQGQKLELIQILNGMGNRRRPDLQMTGSPNSQAF